MKIETRTVGDITILDCSGKITLGEGTMMVRNAVRDILKNNGKKIILNLGDVNYIDSSGIGELVSSYTTAKRLGGDLKLTGVPKTVRCVLQITALDTVFEIFDDEEAALRAFGQSRGAGTAD